MNSRSQAKQTSEAPLTFAVLVFPGFPMMAFSSVIEPLRAANVLARRECYRWVIVGADQGTVEASNGVVIQPGFSAADAPKVDRIVVCSGGDADHVVADEAMGWIRKSLRNGAHIGAVADAAFFLARAGLLDGHACTLHWTSQAAFTEAFPDIELRRDLFVIDRKRFTSAGGVGSLDMMLEIVTQDYGAELAAGVAEWFVHSPLRSSVDRKLMPLRLRTGVQNELVLSAIAIMEDAVEERLGMAELAERLGVSPDKLERNFRAELAISPNGYYRRLRLKRAADLLAHSTLMVRDVALACGFASMSSFARAFREEHGHAPKAMRRH
ncbi:Transcriptional regulator GlxA family, contains an amidase domain and an AraC-type DNA-binding HTH domain [Mesorhizobium sp. NFR06]|uniref:GlxA family transcriptional regulator n=1 Tax=Mesorhizobium sp. NFR06 TaxID=1566290 RepID=UPI0008E154CC|nr:GlxA family transcriptional regulator [Mesorhizobium sp. NFR06]SFO54770.1 Transcriptional regulator GlxA family, contains an amidase domain and an AraC-type DNA-binding HTH domain [Mesorhizobium sp. NFR06]